MVIKEANERNLNIFKIKVTIAKGCAFKSVRAFMVVRNLSEKGEIIKSSPSSKDIEEGNFDSSFYMGYITDAGADEIEKILYKIAEIERVDIQKEKTDTIKGAIEETKEADGEESARDVKKEDSKNEG